MLNSFYATLHNIDMDRVCALGAVYRTASHDARGCHACLYVPDTCLAIIVWSFLSAYLELFAFHLLSLSGMPHRFTVAFLLAFFLCFFLSILSLRVSLLLSFVLSSRLAAPSISQANETATPERGRHCLRKDLRTKNVSWRTPA